MGIQEILRTFIEVDGHVTQSDLRATERVNFIIVATEKYRVVSIVCVSVAREITDRGAGCESPRR